MTEPEYPYPHPLGDQVMIVGADDIGVIAESDGFRYYLTDCCLASAKGSMAGDEPVVVCRACYTEVDEALGGIPVCGEPSPVYGDAARCTEPWGHPAAHVHVGPRDHITALWAREA